MQIHILPEKPRQCYLVTLENEEGSFKKTVVVPFTGGSTFAQAENKAAQYLHSLGPTPGTLISTKVEIRR
jgi:hypothetical protein